MILDKLSQLSGPARFSIIRLQGPARFGGAALSAFYAGNGSNLSFLRGLFFEQAVAQVAEPSLYPTGLRAALRRLPPEADLALCEVPPLWTPFLPLGATIRVPAWVRQELCIGSAKDATNRWLLSRSLERDVARLIRRHGYVIEFTTDEGAKRLFFRQFYRPYVQSRFGAGAVVADEGGFMKRCQGQTLARLRAGDDYVAGMLPSSAAATCALAVSEPRRTRLPQGRARCSTPASSGTRLIGSDPHHHGGLPAVPCRWGFRYKAKFGAKIAPTQFPQPVLAILVRRWTPPLPPAFASSRW